MFYLVFLLGGIKHIRQQPEVFGIGKGFNAIKCL